MRIRFRFNLWIVAWSAAALGLLGSAPARAHEKWFTESHRFPVTWEQAFSVKTLLVLGVVAAGLAAAYALDALIHRVRGPRVPANLLPNADALERIFGWVPLVLGIHAAVPLLASGLQLQLFATNLQLPRNIFGALMALAEITVALSFIYGAFTRIFALVLIALIPLGFFFFSPAYVLEHLGFAGIAAFLFITGRGPFSVDALIGTPSAPLVRYLPFAVPALRVCTGAAIVVLGFTEKVWNEQLAESFLSYQNFNFFPALGFTGFTNEYFIVLAGIVEVLVGAVLISGKLTRLVIMVAWVPFNLTLPFLGWVELVGHLSIYGTMVVLLVWGPGQDLTPYVRSLIRARPDVRAGEPLPAQRRSSEARG